MNDPTPGCTPLFNWLFCFLWMLGFLTGGAAGASVAWLLTPQSGRVTREMMRRKLSDTVGSAHDLKDRLMRRGQTIWNEARHRVDGAVAALAGDGGAKLHG